MNSKTENYMLVRRIDELNAEIERLREMTDIVERLRAATWKDQKICDEAANKIERVLKDNDLLRIEVNMLRQIMDKDDQIFDELTKQQ